MNKKEYIREIIKIINHPSYPEAIQLMAESVYEFLKDNPIKKDMVICPKCKGIRFKKTLEHGKDTVCHICWGKGKIAVDDIYFKLNKSG